jgi:hypothetical protein
MVESVINEHRRTSRMNSDTTNETGTTDETKTANEPGQSILTPCEALRMLEDALGEAQIDEPEALVRLLLFLADNFDHASLKATVQTLVRAAFDNSIVHAIAFEDYVEAIRGGQNPLKIVRAALREAEHGRVNSETEPPNNGRGGQYG